MYPTSDPTLIKKIKRQTHTETQQDTMKGRRHASPGEAVGNVYFFGFVLFFFWYFPGFLC